MATTAFPSRDDFAALLNESLGGENEAFEGRVVKGKVTAIENDLAVIDAEVDVLQRPERAEPHGDVAHLKRRDRGAGPGCPRGCLATPGDLLRRRGQLSPHSFSYSAGNSAPNPSFGTLVTSW